MIAITGLSVNASANPAHQQLIRLTDAERNTMFTRYVQASHEKCDRVTRNFYQGSDNRDRVYWNVRCRDGHAYVIQLLNDTQGSTRILSCDVLQAVGGGQCFKKF